jgi:hypothetical protein
VANIQKQCSQVQKKNAWNISAITQEVSSTKSSFEKNPWAAGKGRRAKNSRPWTWESLRPETETRIFATLASGGWKVKCSTGGAALKESEFLKIWLQGCPRGYHLPFENSSQKNWRSLEKGATGDGGEGARPADACSEGWSEEAAVGSQSRSRKEPRKKLGV